MAERGGVLMKEYKIKITGEYDVIVLSPKMIALLIERIRGSDTRELVKLTCEEQDCFDRVEIIKPEGLPKFDMNTSSDFYIVTKQENCQFRYIVQTDDEEISIVLEYL
ncbi:MAG TPA: hypothetical protein IAA57_04505 [Candidatus Pullilachnospira intestinigallinarum]|nr:hypothetical protein [Candidatus Pullilachnospira intestinigallinarum]